MGWRNIHTLFSWNICLIITGSTSRLTNHSSITGVTDCVHQTGGLLIGSCYDLTNGESTLNCESSTKLWHFTSLWQWHHNQDWSPNHSVSLWCSLYLPSILPSSVLFTPVSLPDLSDLAWVSQNALLCHVDHREWGPPLGNGGAQPHRVGAAVQFWEAEVGQSVGQCRYSTVFF